MALAKAFPEYFTYEPHEADAVSGSRRSLWWGQELERGFGGEVGCPSWSRKASGTLDSQAGCKEPLITLRFVPTPPYTDPGLPLPTASLSATITLAVATLQSAPERG